MKKYFNINDGYKTIEKISYIEKKKVVQLICKTYRKIKNLESKYDFSNQKEPAEMLSTFEIILNTMKPDHALVIKKDFLEDNENYLWSEEIWSKTTYYKYAHGAIDEFLSLMYV